MPSKRLLHVLAILGLLLGVVVTSVQASAPSRPAASSPIYGPFVGETSYPTVWNGDMRDLPQGNNGKAAPNQQFPLRLTPSEQSAATWAAALNPNVQNSPGAGQMPNPIMNFNGMTFPANGAGWPPDVNGAIGPNHYVETVNTSVGIYNKTTGALISAVTFNTFFTGPAGTPCDANNQGDPQALYDQTVGRWVVTDFAWSGATGPYYQCIAVSQTNDPVVGGWYFYALRADTGIFTSYLNDYPKMGVWSDGWYLTANMFDQIGTGFGVRVWALNRTQMIAGGALQEVHFDTCTDATCDALLPANYHGATAPPAGAPNYMLSATPPDLLKMWKFHVDWVTPASSTFTGPTLLPISAFEPVTYGVPQQGTTRVLDTLSFRLMNLLQYRNMGSYESLWASHTVDVVGKASVRWYEVRAPGGATSVYQSGTYALGDGNHRWMPSIAADKDGNAAVGYSVSSSTMYPALRYAGRRNGESLGQLPQNEAVLINGTGSQTGISRWGDYFSVTLDPADDCTFWFAGEYLPVSGNNWYTRIGSFKFAACGQTLGTLSGRVFNTVTNAGIAGAPVTVVGPETMTTSTDAAGNYSVNVVPGTYDITGGPLLPGYPTSATVTGRTVGAGGTTTTDIGLAPVPHLAYNSSAVSGGNGNSVPEPGESNLQMLVNLLNDGATTSTGINAVLSTSTAGVTISQNTSAYPNILAGGNANNSTPYVFSMAATMPCGTIIDFQLDVTSTQGPYTINFSLLAGSPQPPTAYFFDNFESGVNGWTTGGTQNFWAQVTNQSYSPTHSWHESPSGVYPNNMNSWVRSPVINLSGKTNTSVSAYFLHALESGYDYAYLEYSLDGGTTWAPSYLARFNGVTQSWAQTAVASPMLDNQSNVALRLRVTSDSGVVADGIYMDDFAVNYTPITCEPPTPTAVQLSNVGAAAPALPYGAMAAALGLLLAAGAVAWRRRTA